MTKGEMEAGRENMKKRSPKILKTIRATEKRLRDKGTSNSLRCPACGHVRSYVIDSRVILSNNNIRRRRVCGKCEGRFTSYEILSERLELLDKLTVFCRELLPLLPAIENIAREDLED